MSEIVLRITSDDRYTPYEIKCLVIDALGDIHHSFEVQTVEEES